MNLYPSWCFQLDCSESSDSHRWAKVAQWFNMLVSLLHPFLFVLMFWGIFKREHKLPKCLVCSRGFHLKKKKIQTHKSNQAYGESFYQTFMTSGKFRFAQTCLYVLKLSPFLFKHCPILPTIPKYSSMEKCSHEFSCLYLSRKMHREGRLGLVCLLQQ